MQNIKIMWFDICKTNAFEIFVNWSQPKTKENFLKDKDLTNKTQRPPMIKSVF